MNDTNKTIIKGTQKSNEIMDKRVSGKKLKEKRNGKWKLRIKESED